ncbi:hypothetical protein JCM8097_007359 [Rhodosporidiobolus ruineniae]
MSIYTTVAPVLISTCLSCFACGVVQSLTATYFARFKKDRLWLRWAVVVAMLVATLDTAINISWSYQWMVVDYMDPSAILVFPWQLAFYEAWACLSIFFVQLFYLYRLYTVSRNWMLCGILSIFAMEALGVGLYMAAFCAKSKLLTDFALLKYVVLSPSFLPFFPFLHEHKNPPKLDPRRNISWGWFGGVFLTDIGITAGMSWYLIFKPRKDGFAATSSPLRAIMVKAVQTNALSLVDAAGLLALNAAFPTAMYSCLFGMVAIKIYTGSFIATLNARNPQADGAFNDTASREIRQKGFGTRLTGQQPVTVTVQHDVAVDDLDAELDKSLDDGARHPYGGGFGTGAPYRVQFDRPAVQGEMEKDGSRLSAVAY